MCSTEAAITIKQNKKQRGEHLFNETALYMDGQREARKKEPADMQTQ